MEKLECKKGMTLIEIVVSLAILGVLSVLFLNVFLGSILLTTRSGERADLVADVSSAIEQKAANHSFTNAAITTSTSSVNVVYNYGTAAESSSSMNGAFVNGSSTNSDGQQVQLEYFIPGGAI
jgi:prepilin-type N-terminal cleavage/methylation domain-containing protein